VAVVGPAATPEARPGLVELWQRYWASGLQRLGQMWGDGGSDAQWLRDWGRGVTQPHKSALAVVERTGKGLAGIQQGGTVERPLAWIRPDRRPRRAEEGLTARSAAMIQISRSRIFLKRLAEEF
jgi:hypothetical protein